MGMKRVFFLLIILRVTWLEWFISDAIIFVLIRVIKSCPAQNKQVEFIQINQNKLGNLIVLDNVDNEVIWCIFNYNSFNFSVIDLLCASGHKCTARMCLANIVSYDMTTIMKCIENIFKIEKSSS